MYTKGFVYLHIPIDGDDYIVGMCLKFVYCGTSSKMNVLTLNTAVKLGDHSLSAVVAISITLLISNECKLLVVQSHVYYADVHTHTSHVHIHSLSCVLPYLVPPLKGFVMNRVTGDYFETLLYKIFVSIDEHTTMTEVCTTLPYAYIIFFINCSWPVSSKLIWNK